MQFTAAWYRILSWIRAVICPLRCASCRVIINDGDMVCCSCLDRIQLVVPSYLRVTSTKQVRVIALSLYQDPVKRLVLAKSRGHIISSIYLARLMWDMTPLVSLEFDYIVPIPLHWRRYAQRGYNQSQEMAQELSRLSGKPVLNALRRVRNTAFQYLMSQEGRAENLKDAFRLDGHIPDMQGKKLLIVDDVLTSGNTICAAARELYRLKPAELIVTVACRA